MPSPSSNARPSAAPGTRPDASDALETLHALSLRMVAAAQANDWDALAAIERDMAHTRDQMIAQQAAQTQHNTPATDAAGAQRKAELITAMLAHDAEVRRHVEPWLASARKLLTGHQRGRAVRAAYAAHAPTYGPTQAPTQAPK